MSWLIVSSTHHLQHRSTIIKCSLHYSFVCLFLIIFSFLLYIYCFLFFFSYIHDCVISMFGIKLMKFFLEIVLYPCTHYIDSCWLCKFLSRIWYTVFPCVITIFKINNIFPKIYFVNQTGKWTIVEFIIPRNLNLWESIFLYNISNLVPNAPWKEITFGFTCSFWKITTK